MAIPPDKFKLLNELLGFPLEAKPQLLRFPLDKDHRFLKVSLKKEPFELLTKTLQDCKHPQKTYENQINLFKAVSRLLRTHKVSLNQDREQPGSSGAGQDQRSPPLQGGALQSDVIMQKALKVYHFILQKMGDRNTQNLRWDLASAFDVHCEKHLSPQSMGPNLGRTHADSFSSMKKKFERSVRLESDPLGSGQDELSRWGRKASLDAPLPQTDEESPPLQGGALPAKELDSTKQVAIAKPGLLPVEDKVKKTSSQEAPSGRPKEHLRRISSTGDIQPPTPPIDSVSPRKSSERLHKSTDSPTTARSPQIPTDGASRKVEALRQTLAQNEGKHKEFILQLTPEERIALEGYWRGDAKEGFQGILKKLKGFPSRKKFDEIKDIPLMRLALQVDCSQLLGSLPENKNSWALDLIRQSFNIGYAGETLSPSDVPAGLNEEQLKDEKLLQKYYKEKFEAQTRAFKRVLKGLLSQPPFQLYKPKILEVWQWSLRAITTLDDESAVVCCEAFLENLLINREAGEDEEQKKIDAAGKKLARILRCFRQDVYVSATSEIRNFFKQTDYKRVEDNYTYFYSFEADGTVKIDVTSIIKCQTSSLSIDMIIENKLRSPMKDLDSAWDSCINFTIASVLPLDRSLVDEPDTIPEHLELTILKPLLKLGYPVFRSKGYES